MRSALFSPLHVPERHYLHTNTHIIFNYIIQAHMCGLHVCLDVSLLDRERKLLLMSACRVWDLVIFLCSSGAGTADFLHCCYDKNLLNHESSSLLFIMSLLILDTSSCPINSSSQYHSCFTISVVLSGKWMMYNTQSLHSHNVWD